MTPEAAEAACLFAQDAPAMLLWGAFGYLASAVPRALAHEVGRRLATFGVVAGAVALSAAIAMLPVEAATVGNGWPDATSLETIRAVLFETDLGGAWAARCLAGATLVLAAFLPERKRLAGTALAAGLFLGTLALQGHAVMQEGWIGAAHQVNDALHVLAGGAWLGALVPLVPILATLDRSDAGRDASTALRRFSTAGHGAVALVIATGVVNTVLVIGRWPTDWASPYLALLGLKITLVAIMTGLAVVNRYSLVPRLRRRRESTLQALRTATLVELALGLAAVACVSVFGLLEPPS